MSVETEAPAAEEGAGVTSEGERTSHLDKPGPDLRPDDTDEIEKFREFLGEAREDLTDPNMHLDWGELDAEGFRDPEEKPEVSSVSATAEKHWRWGYHGNHRRKTREFREWITDWWERFYIWLVEI